VSDLEERLAARTLALVDIASTSGDEGEILEALEVPGSLPVADAQDSVRWYGPVVRRPAIPMVLLAGHVDTVPPNGNLPGRMEDRAVVGRGAADMKGALAVMEALAHDLLADGEAAPGPEGADLALLFFGREELPITQSALLPLFERCPGMGEVDLAIVMEPTANELELGCMGNLNARVTVAGRTAHSARPWLGENAIHGAVRALQEVAASAPHDVTIGGLTFREVVSVTTIEGGLAANVVPDLVRATVNYRYAPGTEPASAETALRAMLPGVELEVVGNAPPGPADTTSPLVERLRRAGGLRVRPKQAWTPVAEFATIGVPAVNLGPGDPGYAHRDDERVEAAALARCYRVLRAFFEGGAAHEDEGDT
jgi:succinyl-diaminopimelate desuccinylase